ncbi:MAG: cytochrome c-type biogenesis protein CcmH [Nitrospirae bacterium]|nr:cytochrome c-type biogenesis protein CcmH [Nitrospirota bacterium]
MKTLMAGLALALLMAATTGHAREAVPSAADPAIEARMKDLTQDLRCLVCQNQTLADSDADLAKDFRREIRTMMQEGRTDAEIVDFLVDRYGDFVLYRPPFKGITMLLWIGPAVLLLGGALALIVTLRRRRAATTAAPSPDELERARKLLEEDNRA